VTSDVRTAALFMVAALACYSTGVWSEHFAARLKPWHLVMFWLGWACDTTGTARMERLAGGLRLTFHGVTGALALVLMLVHAAWATIVLARKHERLIVRFHRFSVVVWCVWLVPMFGGLVLGASV
jgi:uncharacterized repeat protein (TIGR03987 family)